MGNPMVDLLLSPFYYLFSGWGRSTLSQHNQQYGNGIDDLTGTDGNIVIYPDNEGDFDSDTKVNKKKTTDRNNNNNNKVWLLHIH